MNEGNPPADARETYTSTVTALCPATIMTVGSIGIAVFVLVLTGLSPVNVLIAVGLMAVLVIPVGLHLATVRITIGGQGVSLGLGLAGRARWIQITDIRAWRTETVRWPQVFGIGIHQTWRLTRALVRPGPTLWLTVAGGEQLCISVADLVAPCRLLDGYASDAEQNKERKVS